MRFFRAHGRYGYARGHRWLEIAGISAFLGMLLFLNVRIGLTVKEASDWLMLGACLGLGLLASDLLSGVVHWAGDTLFETHTPVLGKHFIRPFREHHVNPTGIARHDFVETNGNNCIATLPMLGAVTPVMPEEPGVGLFTCSTVVFAAAFLFATNQFHKWAHAERAPRLARWLQRWGVILTPTHHDIHHRPPHDRYYCITVGWMNPVLARLRFFRVLEWMVAIAYPRLLAAEVRAAGRPPGQPAGGSPAVAAPLSKR